MGIWKTLVQNLRRCWGLSWCARYIIYGMLFYRIIHFWISWWTLWIAKDFGNWDILQRNNPIYIWMHIAMVKLQELHCLCFYLVLEWIFTVMWMANCNRYNGKLVWNVWPWFYSRRVVIVSIGWKYNWRTYGQCVFNCWIRVFILICISYPSYVIHYDLVFGRK